MDKRITDRYGNTVGYEKSDGRITDQYGNTTGYVKSDGRTTDRYGNTTGYRKDDGRVTDKYGNTDAYRKDDGRITDRYGNTTGYSKDDSGGGCYLTTACVKFHNLSDDCDELTTLRNYRDNYMLKTENGKQDLAEYYEKAPKIVCAIEKLPVDTQTSIYEYIYSVIEKCVSFIKNGQNEQAYRKYEDMVNVLSNRFALFI